MRYVVYGAGGIGGVIGGRLHQSGCDVLLVARGDHLRVIRADGLTLQSPDQTAVLDVPAVGHPRDAGIREGDVVVLAMKTQHTEEALRDLRPVAPSSVTIVCAQNGVENERLALRRFPCVVGMVILMPASYLEPGIVQVSRDPIGGVLDVGAVTPSGRDVAQKIATDLCRSGFASRAVDDVMAWKYAKLLRNVQNAVVIACDDPAAVEDVRDEVVAEAVACFAAAGLLWVDDATFDARREVLPPLRPVGGEPRVGSSSMQSLVRGTGNIESDFINGEVALLGRLHGVPTPVNTALQAIANRLAAEGRADGAMSREELLVKIDTFRE